MKRDRVVPSGRDFVTGSKYKGAAKILADRIIKNKRMNNTLEKKGTSFLTFLIKICKPARCRFTKQETKKSGICKVYDYNKLSAFYQPLFEMISSLFMSTTSMVLPKTFMIPSFLKSERVLMTFAVLIPI
jgi:hypothetical protein